MEKSDELIEQILQIKSQYESQVSGKHKQWPRVIKDRIVSLFHSGMKIHAIAERTGISPHTVASWTAKMNRKSFREIKVSVAAKAVAPTPQKFNGTVTIVSPSGYRIEGIDSADVAALLQKIERR